jgi:hypothetical protein
MRRNVTNSAPRAERRAAPKPARIPRATKGPLVAPGDRPMYSSDEGQT